MLRIAQIASNASHAVNSAAENWKIAITIGGSTITLGATQIIDLLSGVWAFALTVVGLVASVMVIRVQAVIYKKTRLDITISQRKEKERLDRKRHREESGEPLRRFDD